MTREEYVEKVKEIMIKKNPYGRFYQNFSLGDFTSFMEMNGKSSF